MNYVHLEMCLQFLSRFQTWRLVHCSKGRKNPACSGMVHIALPIFEPGVLLCIDWSLEQLQGFLSDPLVYKRPVWFWETLSSLSLHCMTANLSRDASQLTLRPPGFTLKIHATENLISRNLEWHESLRYEGAVGDVAYLDHEKTPNECSVHVQACSCGCE